MFSSFFKNAEGIWYDTKNSFNTRLTSAYFFSLRNVYKEPLKKCQVEGCLLTVEPDLLFGNLDQICRVSVTLYILKYVT